VTPGRVASVRFLPAASAEVEAAFLWYEEQRVGLGSEFLAAINDAVSHVVAWPEASPSVRQVDGIPVRRVPVSRFPYVLFYYRRQKLLRVVAVAHTRRRPRYWASRL